MWPLAKGRVGDSQEPHFLSLKAEHQERTSPSLGARVAPELAQVHRQPQKSSHPLYFYRKRYSFPSLPVPSASLSGLSAPAQSSAAYHRHLQRLLCKQLLPNSLTHTDFCFYWKRTLHWTECLKTPCTHMDTHTFTNGGVNSCCLGTSTFNTGLKHNSTASPHLMKKLNSKMSQEKKPQGCYSFSRPRVLISSWESDFMAIICLKCCWLLPISSQQMTFTPFYCCFYMSCYGNYSAGGCVNITQTLLSPYQRPWKTLLRPDKKYFHTFSHSLKKKKPVIKLLTEFSFTLA